MGSGGLISASGLNFDVVSRRDPPYASEKIYVYTVYQLKNYVILYTYILYTSNLYLSTQ